MQEQNFERQVKERMEEFTIPPSAPVWQKIEKEIRRKRERRRAIFWLLPLLLAGGAIIWLADNKDFASPDITSPVKVVDQQETNIANGPTAPVEDIQQEQVTGTETSVPYSSSIDENSLTSNSSRNITIKNSTSAAMRSVANLSKKDAVTVPHDPIIVEKTVSTSKEETQTTVANNENHETSATVTVTPKEIATVNDEKNVPSVTDDFLADSAASTSATATSIKRKWKTALQATAGFSQTGSTLFPGTKIAESNVVPNSIGYVPPGSYAEPTMGRFYSAGLSFSTSVTPRIRFTTGLQYSYASTFQKVGNRVDSTAASPTMDPRPYVWLNNGTATYQNRFHFIELPLGVDVRLMSSLPVDLHGGLSVSRLIASNALHYDQSSDVYYRNNGQLQKTSVHLYGGMSYGLFRERLKIGPHLRYSLIPLNTGERKQYLMTASLRAIWSLN